MFSVLRRIISLVLLGWFAFVMFALATAVRRKAEAPPLPAPDANVFDIVTVFEELNFRSTAPALREGRVETRFAGGVVDLRDATLDPGGATLELFAMFGGGQLVIPDEWRVTIATTNVAGGIVDARGAVERPADAPHLTIEGLSVFGGWGIASEGPARSVEVAASA